MPEARLGQVVRRLREAQGLSLRTLAARTGFSASFLSQVENEQASPSIASMERIGAALGVTLGEFFQRGGSSSFATVVRAGAHVTLESGWSKARIDSLAPEGQAKRLEPILVTIQPGGSSATRPYPAPTEEFALVLEGSVVLTSGGDHEQVLGEGDAVTIPAGVPRRCHNASEPPFRLVVVPAL